MKNREKYKNELMDFIKTDGRMCGFVKKHEVSSMLGKDIESLCEMDCIACEMVLNLWLDEEYEEPEVDWSKVPVDTLVRVRDLESEEWTLRYFKGIDEEATESRYMAWGNGTTSKTAYGNYTHWRYCELVEDEDKDK